MGGQAAVAAPGGVVSHSVGRLHVITDEVLQDRFDHVTLARLALAGGADVIQYREKRAVPDRVRLQVATAIAQLCADAAATLIVDDRADIARAVGAGVHVGPRDLPVRVVRELVRGPVGATVNDLERAEEPDVAAADYLGVGAVYATASKGAVPPPVLGLDGLRAVVRAVSLPVVAIGGITVERLPYVLEAGAHGVAVLGAVCLSKDPTEAAAAYAAVLGRAGGQA